MLMLLELFLRELKNIEKILESLKVDYTHILVKGHITHTGDGSLVEQINKEGFEKYI